MNELFSQLGLDWKLLLSQTVNFLILLVVLKIFAYGPILKVIKDRRTKIEEGLAKGAEAEKRLDQANQMVAARMKAADEEALTMLRATETKSKELEVALLAAAKRKETDMFAATEQIIKGKAEEARREMQAEAAAMVKAALVATVELSPEAIDEALIKKAVSSINK